jgi:GNAT superfamily N-acetyltransferase
MDDFYRVHSPENEAGWCFCAAWWTSSWQGWGERTEAQNLALREELMRTGGADGYLFYLDGEPVGWCQCLLRDRLPKLGAAYALEPDTEMWALSCFLLAPKLRGRGLGHVFLALVLADLRARGVERVQAFPRRGLGLPAEDVWTGPEGLFRRAGFHLERDDERLPVYRLDLARNPV